MGLALQARTLAVRLLFCTVISFAVATCARAQEIRAVAAPNQPVRMTHNGYVCAGRLNISPIDDTYDMVTCSGPIYAAPDYAAVYQKRTFDELVKLNNARLEAIDHDLRAAVDRRIGELPRELQQSAAIQSLRRSLLEDIDRRRLIAESGDNAASPRVLAPDNSRSRPAPNEP
jgi:hypothetical protein